MIPLRENFMHELLVAREPVRFRQGEEVLVPVKFPGNFAIANLLEIEIVDFEPGPAWPAFAVDNVEVPVNAGAIVKIGVTEQIEPMLTQFMGLGYNASGVRRKPAPQQSAQSRSFCWREEKPASRPDVQVLPVTGKDVASAVA
jgi:hypothetical protein